MDAFFRSLPKGELAPVYYLHGPEDVLKDEALMDVATRMPRSIADLQRIRDMPREELGSYGPAILQAVVTTTPKPTKLVKELVADPTTVVTRGSTYDNTANLAAAFIQKVVKKYEGTRLGRQELNAEVLDDVPGALWNRQGIEDARWPAHRNVPDFSRIVVAIDPAASALRRIVLPFCPRTVTFVRRCRESPIWYSPAPISTTPPPRLAT